MLYSQEKLAEVLKKVNEKFPVWIDIQQDSDGHLYFKMDRVREDYAWLPVYQIHAPAQQLVNDMLGINEAVIPYFRRPDDCVHWQDYHEGFMAGYKRGLKDRK